MSNQSLKADEDDEDDEGGDDAESTDQKKTSSEELLKDIIDEENEEEEDEEEEEEQDEVPADVPLTAEMIVECLSLLCKTGDGMAHAYVRLTATERDLTDIELLNSYIHVRYIDISTNRIKDLTPLNNMTHLLTLSVDSNMLTTVGLVELPYLQRASFAKNRIENLNGVNHPLLEIINLNSNQISAFEGLDSEKLGRLHTLELRGNKLKNLVGLDLPNLKNLYLADNLITSLDGLHRLENLHLLHLRDNSLVKLDGFAETNGELNYVNLRGNKIEKLKELKKLKCLKSLKALVLLDNPVDEQETCRIEALVSVPILNRVNKDEVTEEEQEEAAVLRQERKEQGDEDEEDEEEKEEEEEEEGDEEMEDDDREKKSDEQSVKGDDDDKGGSNESIGASKEGASEDGDEDG